jgi:hypothetical protein
LTSVPPLKAAAAIDAQGFDQCNMALGGRPLARLNSTPASRKARTASMVR